MRVALVLTAVILGGCGGGTHLITGTSRVRDTSEAFNIGAPCHMDIGYDDITEGASVTVKDGAGTIIALAELKAGTAESAYDCVFPFSVTVGDSNFYSIEISHRGEVNYTKAELEAQKWTIALTIGD